jgi:hypothetical protein
MTDMAAVFDLAKTRIGNKRDQVEDALRDRVDKFEKKVRKKLAFTIKNTFFVHLLKNILFYEN